jgi:hypothetical protein
LPRPTYARSTRWELKTLILIAIFFTVPRASAGDGRCEKHLREFALSHLSPKGELGQIIVGLGRALESELALPVRQSQSLPPGLIQGVINAGQVVALEYRVDSRSEDFVFNEMIFMLIELRRLRELRDAGARFRFKTFSSLHKEIELLSLDPSPDQPVLRWWKARAARRRIRYALDSHLDVRGTFAPDEGVRILSDLLRLPAMFDETVIHESVHAQHETDPTKTIYFSVPAPPGKLPGVPGIYAEGMLSGEFEAQYIGETRGDLARRPLAWEKARPFLVQRDWLHQLLVEMLGPGGSRRRRSVQTITYAGVRIEIEFKIPPSVFMPAESRAWILGVVFRRLRQLDNFERVRRRSEDETATRRPVELVFSRAR